MAAQENDVVSLAGTLGRRYDLSREDIYSLSVTLSSSLLQLSQTPWLGQPWTKTDILFIRARSLSGQKVDFKHPYLAKEHKTEAFIAQNGSSSQSDSSKVLGLGVLLVEIVSGQPIESLRLAEDLGSDQNPNEFTDLQVVQRWISEQEDLGNLTLAFRSAISYCLKCFVGSSLDLKDAAARVAIEENVLAPLQEEMAMLFG